MKTKVLLNFLFFFMIGCSYFQHLPCSLEILIEDNLKLSQKILYNLENTSLEQIKNKDYVQNIITKIYDIDQDIRISLLSYLKNMSPEFKLRLNTIDFFHTETLKILLNGQGGWVDISIFGKEIDQKAWIIVQHADHDPKFQKDVLKILKEKLELNETQKENYAYLYDRLAIKSGTQRYGTQFKLDEANNSCILYPLEDPSQLDNLRKHMNLIPMEDYLKFIKKLYKCKILDN